MQRLPSPNSQILAACVVACLCAACCRTTQPVRAVTGDAEKKKAVSGAFDAWRRTLPKGRQALFVPETPITMTDGWLSAAAWQNVEPVAFHYLDGTGDTPQAPTLARAVTKQGLLFLRFECREPDMGHLVYAHAGRDSAALWRDDVVEILLQPGDTAPLYHLMLNPIGASFDAVEVPGKAEDASWDPPLRSRTFIEKDRWAIELSLPLSACPASGGVSSSNAPTVWRANLIRARQGRPGAFAEDTGWCSTRSTGAGRAASLGYLYVDVLSNGRPLPAAATGGEVDRKRACADLAKVAAALQGTYNRPVLVVDPTSPVSNAIQLIPLSETAVGAYEPTEVRVLREAAGLRLQVRCSEAAPQSIQAKPDTASDKIWCDDCVEVFLAPGRKESSDYLHLVVNAAGVISTECGTRRAAIDGIKAAARVGTNAWTLDLQVPFAAFGLTPGQIPALWGMNVTRDRPARADAAEQSTVWSRFSWSAHDPASFASLWLADADLFPERGGAAAPADGARPERNAVNAAAWIADCDVFGPAERKALALPSMLDRYQAVIRDQLLAKRDQEWAQAKTKEDALRLKAKIRADFLKAIGGLPESKSPLNPRLSVVFENDELRVERLIYESRPKFYVTANVFVPKKPGSHRLPVVLRIVGHNTNGRHSALAYCEELARSGYFVMTIDALGQGERIYTSNGLGSRTPTSNHYGEGAGFFLTDANLAGYMIYDVMRAIDYIGTRGEADAHRIVLTGESGGGTLTEYVTALDDRIFAAAPVSSGGSDRKGGGSYDSEQVLFGSYPGALDIEGFGALASPRPYCVITETTDEGRQATERSFEIARHLAMLADDSGAGERLKYVPTTAPHGYGKTHYQHFRKWLAQVMPPDADGPRVTGPVTYDHGATRASSSGRAFFSRDLPDCETTFTLNAKRITLTDAFDATVCTREAGAGRSARIRDVLLVRLALRGEAFTARSVESRGTSGVSDCTAEKLVLETDPGVFVPALLLSPRAPAGGALRARAVVWLSSRGKRGVLETRANGVKAVLAAGSKVLIPDLRGLGETAGDPDTTFMGDEASRNGMGIRLARPLIGMRVKDALCCVNYLRTRADVDPAQIGLLGDSPSTPNPAHIRQPVLITDSSLESLTQAESLGPVVALLAFAMDTNVARCATYGLPNSYAAMCTTPYFYHPFGVFVPGILQTCDLADLCAAAAPRPLLLAGSVNEFNQRLDQNGENATAFERAVRGYRVTSAEKALTVQPAGDLQTAAAFFAMHPGSR